MSLKVPVELADLSVAKATETQLVFQTSDLPIHAKLRVSPGAKSLIVLFHGAVDITERRVPVFVPFGRQLPQAAHCLSIADPLVGAHTGLRIGWYAGRQGFDVQKYITELVQAVSKKLKATRRIYTGSSGGGFAALAASHQDSASIAVVGNPQVRIDSYYDAAVKHYREIAWPDLPDDAELVTVTGADLIQKYRSGFDNTVIYLQSLGDRAMHYPNHALPFVAAVSETQSRHLFFFHCDFWGKMGHIAEPRELELWLQAAARAENRKAQTLLELRHKLAAVSKPVSTDLTERAAPSSKGFSPADLQISALLADLRKR